MHPNTPPPLVASLFVGAARDVELTTLSVNDDDDLNPCQRACEQRGLLPTTSDICKKNDAAQVNLD